MKPDNAAPSSAGQNRVDWVDYAKGVCIIMVVFMHSTLGVEKALDQQGALSLFVAWATPFRMPDFFMISGLFMAQAMKRDWRTYFDRKVLHFLYFYVIWAIISWGLKDLAPGLLNGEGAGALGALADLVVNPPGTLWFIYLLPVFFVVTRLTRNVPPALMLGVAAALHTAPHDFNWFIASEFCERYVFFLAGTIFASQIFAFARLVSAHMLATIPILALWAVVNGVLVWQGLAHAPGLSLVLGLAGALAVVAIAVLAAQAGGPWLLRYCGRHSLVVYLAFFVPMAATRVGLIKAGFTDVDAIAAMVTITALVTPLIAHVLLRRTRLSWLFERPARFTLKPAPGDMATASLPRTS